MYFEIDHSLITFLQTSSSLTNAVMNSIASDSDKGRISNARAPPATQPS